MRVSGGLKKICHYTAGFNAGMLSHSVICIMSFVYARSGNSLSCYYLSFGAAVLLIFCTKKPVPLKSLQVKGDRLFILLWKSYGLRLISCFRDLPQSAQLYSL